MPRPIRIAAGGVQQRNDELPKLIDTCKAYLKHEAGLLTNITELRTVCAGSSVFRTCIWRK